MGRIPWEGEGGRPFQGRGECPGLRGGRSRGGVRYLSLFAFSEENWGRPEGEVRTLMSLMLKSIADEIDSLAAKGVSFRVIGNLSRLDDNLVEVIKKAERLTAPASGKEPF